jgi:uncharacterized protein YeaO (DUF488 family)
MKPIINIKRVYEPPSKKDGYRILVDRLWPRGLTKEKVAVSEWTKELAPTPDLRKWYGHAPGLWKEFQPRYVAELKKNMAVAQFIESHANQQLITLVYAAKDPLYTHAVVLQQFLQKQYAGYEL